MNPRIVKFGADGCRVSVPAHGMREHIKPVASWVSRTVDDVNDIVTIAPHF